MLALSPTLRQWTYIATELYDDIYVAFRRSQCSSCRRHASRHVRPARTTHRHKAMNLCSLAMAATSPPPAATAPAAHATANSLPSFLNMYSCFLYFFVFLFFFLYTVLYSFNQLFPTSFLTLFLSFPRQYLILPCFFLLSFTLFLLHFVHFLHVCPFLLPLFLLSH